MTKEFRQYKYEVPKGAVDLTLVRHGESSAAIPGTPFPLHKGHGDPDLHVNGIQQAKLVKNALEKKHFQSIYATDLKRTQQTAEPLATRLSLPITIEPGLREVHLGEWEGGLFRMKVASKDPLYHEFLMHQEWGKIPGAETNAMIFDRVRKSLDLIYERHQDQKVVAVIHGGIISAIMAMATGSNPLAFLGSSNGSISRVILESGKITLRTYNSCEHL
jgi:2,3-bisphosphoglycerate-dependent phosphoglycerate mutase